MNTLITTQYNNLLCAIFYQQCQIDTGAHVYVNNAMQNFENSIKKNKDSVLKPKKLKTQSKIQPKTEINIVDKPKPKHKPKPKPNPNLKTEINIVDKPKPEPKPNPKLKKLLNKLNLI